MSVDIDALFDELFPICRSITGDGIRRSLEILQDYIPFELRSVPSGTQVFDWTVPQEWRLNRATLHDPDGRCILDTDDCNLHVVNYSEPFQGEVSLEELQNHLHSLPALPDAIPYVTSYYKPRWGLCISDRQRQTLQDGSYTVHIDTEKTDGVLNYGYLELPGESEETILLSTYLCHPSMANNELSGPLCMVRLYQMLAQRRKRRYTYLFYIGPETIGSIAFLAQEKRQLQARVAAGIVLTCLGGHEPTVSFKLSRRDWIDQPSAIDRLARSLAESDGTHFSIRKFTPVYGSDERQYCSPGINLPIIQAAKTDYDRFPEYHTSADNKALMTIDAVERSSEQLIRFLDIFEISDLKLCSTLEGGEPQLGKRGLYPNLNGPMSNILSNDHKNDDRYMLNLLLGVLSLSDGTFTMPDIAEKLNSSSLDILPIVEQLVGNGLVKLETGQASP